MKKTVALIISTFIITYLATAQSFTGTWKAQKTLKKGTLSIEISIANPVHDVLYPAYLKIEYQRFKGLYEVLLAQKDAHTLAIGRDKISVKESPFSLGDILIGFHGYLNLHGKELELQSLDFLPHLFINTPPELAKNNLLTDLKSVIWQSKLIFSKESTDFDPSIPIQKITNPSSSDYYYGIYRPIIVTNGMVSTRISSPKNNDSDTASLIVNRENIFKKTALKSAPLSGQIDLKPGINTFVLFADNFGKIPGNSGVLRIYTDRKSYEFDLGNNANKWGTFLVAQLDLNTSPTEIPFSDGKDIYSIEAQKRSNKLLGRISIHNPEIKLDIWDAQEEDKDSISVGLNNQWIQNGIEVKNKVKSIHIKLKPGKNTLLFMAQNLGLIAPNTAFIKLRFDQQERVIEINTDLQKNNIIELYVDDNTNIRNRK